MLGEQADEVQQFSSGLIKDVRNLVVIKQAYQTSLEIYVSSLGFPKIEQYALADQLRRSSKSVCANIAEGFNTQEYSKPEFSRFLAMAGASAGETQVWLQYAYDLAYISEIQFMKWNKEYFGIKSMLFKLRKKL